MRLYTLWCNDDGSNIPWALDAVDEYTVENNGGFPQSYLANRKGPDVRELIIDVPESAVRALFEAPTVKGAIVKDDGTLTKS